MRAEFFRRPKWCCCSRFRGGTQCVENKFPSTTKRVCLFIRGHNKNFIHIIIKTEVVSGMSKRLSSEKSGSGLTGGNVVSEGLRRREATVSGGASTLETEDCAEYNRAFQADDQKVFLWHTANLNLRPAAPKPAFRLLGLFESVDDAGAHGRRILAADPSSACAMRISSTHAWYTIPVDMFTDLTPHTEKVNRNLTLHKKVQDETTDEFLQHKSTLTAGRKPVSLDNLQAALATNVASPLDLPTSSLTLDDASKLQTGSTATPGEETGVEETKDDDTDFSRITPSLPAENTRPEEGDASWTADVRSLFRANKTSTFFLSDNAEQLFSGPAPTSYSQGSDLDTELKVGVTVPPLVREADVRNQKYAVVSVMPDYEAIIAKSPLVEPGVCVWGAFDTESEALIYSKKVVAKHLQEHDIAIVTMYEWVYPHLITSDKVPQLYRNAELNHIMKHARTSRTAVSEFEQECKDNQLEVPTLEIEPDLKTEATRIFTPVLADD